MAILGWKSLTIFVIVIGICYKIVEKPRIPKSIDEISTEYETFDIESPILYGMPLKIFRYILEIPIIGTFLARILYTMNEFHLVRDFATNLKDMPLYLPRRLTYDDEYKQHLKMSQQRDYKSILNVNNFNNLFPDNNNPSLTELFTVENIIKSYISGKSSPIDIIQQSLNAYSLLNDNLNIFIELNKDDILLQAKESTKRWKNNKPLSILDGIPIAVKDEFHVIGYNTTFGTSFMAKINGISTIDSPAVKKIRKLGAIIFGKTNMHEIGLFPSGINSNWGSARNPYSYDLIHDTGGSSSGSGAAIASGIVPLALGADGGGSIRIPSSYNGIVGLKATYGRIPFLPQGAAWSCVHDGFLANTVRDQVIGYMAIAGHNEDDDGDEIMHPKISLTNPPIHFDGFNNINDLSDINIGIYWDWFNDAQAEVKDECLRVVNILIDKYNANLINITIPYLSIISKAHSIMILSEWIEGDIKYINKEYNYNKLGEYVDSTQSTMKYAQGFDIVDLLSSMKIRNWLLKYFNQNIFNKIDILITPMTSITAPQYNMDSLSTSISDLKTVAKSVQFAFLGNFIGIPAISVPISYTEYDGNGETHAKSPHFPISIQLMANHWNEHVLFRVANLIEQKIVKRKLPPSKNMFKYTDLL